MRWLPWRRNAQTLVLDPADEERSGLFGRRKGAQSAKAPYLLPTNDQEISRLDFQHYLLRFAFKGNFLAPIGRPRDILDVGCGTGRWAMEMADLFPGANSVGLDLTSQRANDPSNASHPAPDNYRFVQGNVLEGLPFPDSSFDFVHMRLLFLAIPIERWPGVVRELARVTRGGGYVELVDGDLVRNCGEGFGAIRQWSIELSQKRGIDPRMTTHIGDWLREAGLAQVTFREVLLPVGRYGGRIGAMTSVNLLAAAGSIGGPVVAQGLASQQEYDRALDQAKREFDQPRGTAVWPFYLAFGRKV